VTIIQEVQDFWNARPCNIRHGVSPIGSEEWSREVTRRKYFVEPHIPVFAQFERWTGKNVLEVGCGIGTDTLEFVRAGAHVSAIDISNESIALAQQRFKYFVGPHSPVFFTCENAEECVPHAFGGFDLAYSFGVLHHTPHPTAALVRMRNAMKMGGELRIMLYAKWSLKNILGDQPEAQAGCPIAKVYSVKEAAHLLEKSGFKVESIEKTHIFPWNVRSYVNHKYEKEWYWKLVPARVFKWLEGKLGWHLLIVGRKA